MAQRAVSRNRTQGRADVSALPLACAAVVVDDPEAVAAVFERDLGLPRREVPVPGGGAVP